MMFCLQKYLLVLLFKSLIISCVSVNLRLSKSENNIELKNSYVKNRNEIFIKDDIKESYSLLEKNAKIERTPVNYK
jgi:hypothetical protein